jgi:hypothetical protein
MLRRGLRTTAIALALAATALGASGPTLAQPASPSPGPDQPPPPGAGQDQGQYNVPPPPGYQPGDAQQEASPQAREQDQRFSYEAERWAARNCVAQHANNTVAGTVIGGVLGAIIGGGLAGRYDRGAGIVAGGALGAVAGGAIGSASANSNPNCPPGYGLASGAAPFYPGPVYGEEVYVAPGWYDPWIWYGGHWIYRPYPYHHYWYRSHFRGR